MRFTKRIQDLPTNKNGERQLEPHHLDDNFAAQDDALLTTLGALFAAGGVAVPGIVTLTALNLRVQGRTGITLDGRVPVHVDDQTLDLTPLAAGKGLVLMSTDPVTIQRPYTDVVTGESLTDTMNVSAGRLSVIGAGQQGVMLDANGYPVAPSNTVPVAQVTRTAGGATLDSIPNPALTIRAGVGSSGVVSVNGKAGVVTLAPADIGAASAADLATKADLINGFLATAQLPAVAVGELFSVASQAAMLALTAQQGDVAVRTDLANKRFLLLGASATLASWKSIDDVAATGVTTVNGQSGVVVLAAADVGAIPASQKGAASGVATLGPDGILTPAQRPPSSGGLPAGGTAGQVLTKISPTPGDASWQTPGSTGGGGYSAASPAPLAQSGTPNFRPVDRVVGNGGNYLLVGPVVTAPAGSVLQYGAVRVPMQPSGTAAGSAHIGETYVLLQIDKATNFVIQRLTATVAQDQAELNFPGPFVLPAGATHAFMVGNNGNLQTYPTLFYGASAPFAAPNANAVSGYSDANPSAVVVGGSYAVAGPVTGRHRTVLLDGVSVPKGVAGPLDPVDMPVVVAVTDLPAGAVALLDPGTSAPRMIRKRADGSLWYGPIFTNVP